MRELTRLVARRFRFEVGGLPRFNCLAGRADHSDAFSCPGRFGRDLKRARREMATQVTF
jgi:hypothetical protein